MRIVARSTLRMFWQRHPQAEMPLRAWFALARQATWTGPADVKRNFGANVDFRPRNRLIFDIAGNKYRLVVVALYRSGMLYVRFVGTHAEYDRIDVDRI